jgi:hypothetical protein
VGPKVEAFGLPFALPRARRELANATGIWYALPDGSHQAFGRHWGPRHVVEDLVGLADVKAARKHRWGRLAEV